MMKYHPVVRFFAEYRIRMSGKQKNKTLPKRGTSNQTSENGTLHTGNLASVLGKMKHMTQNGENLNKRRD